MESHLGYKGYDIEISANPDVLSPTRYNVKYVIRRIGNTVISGALTGNLNTRSDAERQAEVAALTWIDDHS